MSEEGISYADSLSDEFKGNEAVNQFSDVNGLAKAHVDVLAERTSLQESMPIVPESYEFDFGERTVDEGFHNSWKEKAKELGMTQDQYKGSVEFHNSSMDVGKEAMVAAEQKGLEGLKVELGPDFEKKVDAAHLAIKKISGDNWEEVEAFLEAPRPEGRVGESAVALKLFMQIDKLISEASLESGGGPAPPEPPTTIDGMPMLDFSKSMPSK